MMTEEDTLVTGAEPGLVRGPVIYGTFCFRGLIQALGVRPSRWLWLRFKKHARAPSIVRLGPRDSCGNSCCKELGSKWILISYSRRNNNVSVSGSGETLGIRKLPTYFTPTTELKLICMSCFVGYNVLISYKNYWLWTYHNSLIYNNII